MEPNNEVDINAPSEKLIEQIRQNAAAAPLPPESAPAATPAPAAYDGRRLSPIRTFSSDMAEAIRTKGGSVVRIAIAEEEKRRRAYEENSIRSKKNIMLIVLSMCLIVGALAIAWYGYSRRTHPPAVALAPQTRPDSLIASDDYALVDVAGLQVTDVLAKIRAAVAVPGIEAGSIKNLVLVEGGASGAKMAIPVARFLSALGSHAPSELVRTLKPDFMLGLYLYDTSTLFVVMHGTAHDFLLAGMLSWERDLFSDMAPLFGIDTSSYTKAELESMTFANVIVENRDARAVLGASGKPILFYSFLDQNTIVIAADPKTFFEVVRRY